MINKIHIKNFLSIRSAEVNLGKVNLLIGANNSGKSNFLKAFLFLKISINEHTKLNVLRKIINRTALKNNENNLAVQIDTNEVSFYKEFDLQKENRNLLEIVGITYEKFLTTLSARWDKNFYDEFYKPFYLKFFVSNTGTIVSKYEQTDIQKLIEETKIYSPNPLKIRSFATLDAKDKQINADASNLVSFLDNMRDENPQIIRDIEDSLQKTVSNFQEIRLKKSPETPTKKMLGLVDKNNEIFWADELSEGTLYFLAILAIIHQPNPPKLLLLEEPEKNVHPKRIHEIIDYLFQLSEQKDIQIIMTTHSPLVVDEFKNIPENIHIFDFIDNQTVIKNMKEVIEQSNTGRKAKNYSLLDLTTTTIGDLWLQGFLGGVPSN